MAITNQTSVPAEHAFAVTPNDSTDLAHVTRGLWIGGAGNISVDLNGGETAVLFSGVSAGTMLPLAVTRVRSTNTTATLIVGVY